MFRDKEDKAFRSGDKEDKAFRSGDKEDKAFKTGGKGKPGGEGNMSMKISEKQEADHFRTDSIELEQEAMTSSVEAEQAVSAETEYYCDIYRELAELIGVQNTRKIWKRFRGLSVQFPQRLYSRTYSKEFIRVNMDAMTIREMATQLSLTDRRVRQIVRELRGSED